MCTIRCSGRLGGMYPSMHWAVGCLLTVATQGGVCPEAVCPGDVCPGGICPGVSARGCLPRGCLPDTPCEQNDRHLWKYYLAATLLRTVIILGEDKDYGCHFWCLSICTTWGIFCCVRKYRKSDMSFTWKRSVQIDGGNITGKQSKLMDSYPTWIDFSNLKYKYLFRCLVAQLKPVQKQFQLLAYLWTG